MRIEESGQSQSFKKKNNFPLEAQKLRNMSIDLAVMSQDMNTKQS